MVVIAAIIIIIAITVAIIKIVIIIISIIIVTISILFLSIQPLLKLSLISVPGIISHGRAFYFPTPPGFRSTIPLHVAMTTTLPRGMLGAREVENLRLNKSRENVARRMCFFYFFISVFFSLFLSIWERKKSIKTISRVALTIVSASSPPYWILVRIDSLITTSLSPVPQLIGVIFVLAIAILVTAYYIILSLLLLITIIIVLVQVFLWST